MQIPERFSPVEIYLLTLGGLENHHNSILVWFLYHPPS